MFFVWSFSRSCHLVLIALLIGAVCPLSPEARAETQTSAVSPELGQKWKQGLALIGRGEFDKALSVIDRIADQPAADEQIRQVGQWLTAYEEMRAERDELIEADYATYVGWVKEDLAQAVDDPNKAWWLQAVRDTRKAHNSAPDETAFREAAWLKQVVDGAVAAAGAYEEEGNWFKAAAIYVHLVDLFPQNNAYRAALERCQAQIQLQYAYTPEAEWKTEVVNIEAQMARDAFRKIRSEHIKVPDFRAMAVSALEQILRMANEPKLAEVFEAMADPDNVRMFTSRVQVYLDKAEREEQLTSGQLIDMFDQVLKINRETQLFQPQSVLIREFVSGALRPLDKYTDMLWPVDIDEFNKHTQGKFSGVGIRIQKMPNGPIKVVSPLEDTPAYLAGLQPGDLIIKIEGEAAKKFSIRRAVNAITGEPGTYVRLTIRRPTTKEEFEVRLQRQVITIYTIKGYARDEQGKWKYMIDPDNKIAYIRLTNFTETSTDELREAITGLLDEGMRGIIFDLRDNPGGTLKAAVEVANLFLENDMLIVSTKDRHGKPWEVSASGRAHFSEFPMVVLANTVSASAAEIVTGALQVHKRAKIVGERTFGKGSVQQVMQLNTTPPAYLKLTTAYYYLPNGRCLHREEDSVTWGVDPDIEINLVPKENYKVREQRMKTDILKGKDQDQLTDEDIRNLTDEADELEPDSLEEEELDGKAGPDDREEEGEDDDEAQDYLDSERLEEKLNIVRDDENLFSDDLDLQLETALLILRVRLASGQTWGPAPSPIAAATDETKG